MPTNVDSGVTPLPDGGEVHWSREEVSEGAARVFAAQAASKRYRVVSLQVTSATRRRTHADEFRRGGASRCGCSSLCCSSWPSLHVRGR